MKKYQRRTDVTNSGIKYQGYTKDGFYFKETTSMWCWKQESKGIIHEAKSIEILKKIKDNEFIGKGNYDHSKTHDYQKFEVKSEYLNTEEFGAISKVGSKNYISMLLKRATSVINEYDKRSEGRKKKGLYFIDCLKKSNIEYLHTYPINIYKNIQFKNHLIMKQKVWVFKNITDKKIEKFKKYWNEK